ncbi:hypothetical protein PVK06_035171 [Gossypium arboreum]|uniref:Retrovirus-related Pol polyprotein from transposon TNT 1-94 n=1 Tax=Gossypium arboreum TaxID=29729 RepID=A0ABR0NJ60_GOSAR|nr:hypothetical protein PVK06_035171 [Gossypium arboreum]
MVASKAIKEAIWLQKILMDLKVVLGIEKAITLYCDSNASIANTKETRNNKSTKHIDRKYQIKREVAVDRIKDVVKVTLEDNLVDPFSKTQMVRSFEKHVKGMGIRNMTHLPH